MVTTRSGSRSGSGSRLSNIELPVEGNVSYLVAAAGAAAIYYLWSANQTKSGWFGWFG